MMKFNWTFLIIFCKLSCKNCNGFYIPQVVPTQIDSLNPLNYNLLSNLKMIENDFQVPTYIFSERVEGSVLTNNYIPNTILNDTRQDSYLPNSNLNKFTKHSAEEIEQDQTEESNEEEVEISEEEDSEENDEEKDKDQDKYEYEYRESESKESHESTEDEEYSEKNSAQVLNNDSYEKQENEDKENVADSSHESHSEHDHQNPDSNVVVHVHDHRHEGGQGVHQEMSHGPKNEPEHLGGHPDFPHIHTPPPPAKGSVDYVLIPMILIGLFVPMFTVALVVLGSYDAVFCSKLPGATCQQLRSFSKSNSFWASSSLQNVIDSFLAVVDGALDNSNKNWNQITSEVGAFLDKQDHFEGNHIQEESILVTLIKNLNSFISNEFQDTYNSLITGVTNTSRQNGKVDFSLFET